MKLHMAKATLHRPHKYRAQRTAVHGVVFASKAEASRYQQLLLIGLAGELDNLELQPAFPLVVNGVQVGKYIADFGYRDKSGRMVYEDVKGMPTPVYRLKKRMVEAQYGIEIREVRR